MKAFINKPIENYEGLRVVCDEVNATGSYAASVYSDFGERSENEEFNMDNIESVPVNVSDEEPDMNSTPAILNCPAMSSTIRSVRLARDENTRMVDQISVMNRMLAALQNSTHWYEILYARVMEVDGFNCKVLVEVFDYLQEWESIAHGFMARDVDLRKDWINSFLTSMV